MTASHDKLQARLVLNDAALAIEKFEKTDDERELRVYWFATMGLLRTSFDVLDKVDRKKSTELSTAISAQWKRITENKAANAIFFDFIKAERDLLLHQYEQNAEYDCAPLVVFTDDDKPFWDGEEFYEFLAISSGPYEGQDPRDLVVEAYDWLSARITEIERVIETKKQEVVNLV